MGRSSREEERGVGSNASQVSLRKAYTTNGGKERSLGAEKGVHRGQKPSVADDLRVIM